MATINPAALFGGVKQSAVNTLAHLTPAEQAEIQRQNAIQNELAKANGKKKVSLVDILKEGAGVVGALLGAKQSAQMAAPGQYNPYYSYYPQAEQPKDKTIFIVLAILLVIIVAAIIISKSKN